MSGSNKTPSPSGSAGLNMTPVMWVVVAASCALLIGILWFVISRRLRRKTASSGSSWGVPANYIWEDRLLRDQATDARMPLRQRSSSSVGSVPFMPEI